MTRRSLFKMLPLLGAAPVVVAVPKNSRADYLGRPAAIGMLTPDDARKLEHLTAPITIDTELFEQAMSQAAQELKALKSLEERMIFGDPSAPKPVGLIQA